jgi:hypothetical protein
MPPRGLAGEAWPCALALETLDAPTDPVVVGTIDPGFGDVPATGVAPQPATSEAAASTTMSAAVGRRANTALNGSGARSRQDEPMSPP